MKINKSKSKSPLKVIIVLAVILAAVAGAALVYAYTQHKSENIPGSAQSGVDYNPPSDEQKAAGDQQKEETINQTDNGNQGSSGTGQDIGVSFTALNQSGDQLQIRTLIDTVSSTGVCTLTLVKDGVTVTKQSDIQAGPTSSTCKGFNVPLSELSPGSWQVTVQATIGSQKGSATQAYTVQQ